MANVLIYADTMRFPEIRHEVPIAIPDPFLYAERNGDRHVMIGSMEIPRMRSIPNLQLHPPEEFGMDELLREGKLRREEITHELIVRACRAWGIDDAVVPATFPLEVADHLRANGIHVNADRELFRERRRAKTGAELEGIRRAQKACDAAMGAARDLLRRVETGSGGGLVADGGPLTSERLKLAIEGVFSAHDSISDEMIVSHGPQAAIGHHMGEGQILAGETVVIDIFPRDRASGCYADMTRTFVVGEASDEVSEWHRLCLEALQSAIAMIRPGASGREIFDATCELFEANGQLTQRTKEAGKPLEDGFYHGLGHGVGLEVHEPPGMGMASVDELIVGDVVTVEPGLYRQGFGGVRLEDLVLVTEDGHENLTNFPYDLTP